MMRALLGSACALAVLVAAAPASAQLAIDRLWVDFPDGAAPRADVVIRNESKDRYYVSVAPAELVGPGTPGEKRVEESDPAKLGLLVTPNRLILDPGAMRSIRIVSLNGPLTSDRVYRIKVSPQVGDIESADPGTGNRGVAIKLLAAYDLLVTVRPPHSKANVVVQHSADAIVLRNEGNTNTLLFDGKVCGASGHDEAPGSSCETVGARRLYAGAEWKVPAKSAADVATFKERVSATSDPKSVTY